MESEGSTDSRKRQRGPAEAVGGGSRWLNGGRYTLAAGLKVAEMGNTDTLSSCVIPTMGDANMVNISFRRENGSTFGMTFRSSDNIFTVKESIQAASDLAVARQTLRFKNLILQDEGTLAGYGIHDHVIVDLLVTRVLDEVILVKVKLMYRRPTHIAVTMGSRENILSLKGKIKEKRRNIPVNRMRVYHPITDEHLSGGRTIRECDILLSGVVVYFLDSDITLQVEKLGKDSLINCAKTSMSSKLIAGDSDFFANLVVDAMLAVKMTNARGEVVYPIKGINILKAHGKSARESFLVNGYALNAGRPAQGMPLRVAPAKIACLGFNLQKTKMQLGDQVLATDPRELEKIYQRETDMTKEHIEKLLKVRANVVLTTEGIDDTAVKHFTEAGAIAVRCVQEEDMHHVAKATGATMLSTFADMEGEDTSEPSFLGYADEVVEERIADDAVVIIKGTKTISAVSLILRGANDYMLDEMDRTVRDALSIVKRTLESNMAVPGCT